MCDADVMMTDVTTKCSGLTWLLADVTMSGRLIWLIW